MRRKHKITHSRAIITTTAAFIIALLAVSSATKPQPQKQAFSAQDFIVPIPTCTPVQTTSEKIVIHRKHVGLIDALELPYSAVEIKYEYLGTYFITAYCPSECGWNGDPDNYAGWHTASDTICHRAAYEDRLYEPTTCAIDRNLHSFGDLFYVEGFDRVFVAEDTGSAVKGHHLDLFYEDYEDVIAFPTGYYDVYSVEYVNVTKTIKGKDYDINSYRWIGYCGH